jgi:hypothetical protein
LPHQGTIQPSQSPTSENSTMASENAACLGRVVAATARGVGAANIIIMSTFNLANSAENRTNRSEADARDGVAGPSTLVVY